jgi:quercetin dioxygenase-like cupin family protein
MSATLNVVRPADAPSYWIMGIRATIIARGAPGELTSIELIVPPGAATPTHVHDDDEDSGFILEGTMRIWCDGQIVSVSAGSWLALPRGKPHALRAVSDTPARVMAVYTNTNFADFIMEVGVPTDQPKPPLPGPTDLARLREIAARHNLQLMGPPPPALFEHT